MIADALRQRHQRLAEDLAEDDRVARDRRDEDLLAEVVLAVLDQRDDAERAPTATASAPSTPVNAKARRLKPTPSPKLACRLLPRMPMKISGKTKSAMIRGAVAEELDEVAVARWRGSRRELTASRRSAPRSRGTRPRGRRVRLDDGRAASRSPRGPRAPPRPSSGTLNGAVAANRRAPSRVSSARRRRAVVGVEHDVLLDQLGLDLGGRARARRSCPGR